MLRLSPSGNPDTMLFNRMPLKLAALLVLSAFTASAQSEWKVLKTIPIGGEGSWDYVTVDPRTHHLFVPRSTHTMVIDPIAGKVLADLPGQKIAHGVAIVPELERGFITDGGGDGAIVIFDLKTNAILGSIKAQPDADGIIYDPFTKRILVVSGDKGTLMLLKPDVDPQSGAIEAVIDLGGAPEFLASDEAGKVFINLMDKNEVAAVDLKTRKVVSRWPVAPGGAPVGMSIDRAKHRIVIGCRKPQKLIVMSTVDGKVISDLPIGDNVDATHVHKGQIFASCRDGSLTVGRETAPGKYMTVQTVATPKGAKTMDIDVSTDLIYMPTAQYDPPATGNGLGKVKPGTFMIVVVGRK